MSWEVCFQFTGELYSSNSPNHTGGLVPGHSKRITLTQARDKSLRQLLGSCTRRILLNSRASADHVPRDTALAFLESKHNKFPKQKTALLQPAFTTPSTP